MKTVRSGLRVANVRSFLFGMQLGFQRGQAKALQATYHLRFTGDDTLDATVRIDRGTLAVEDGLAGKADLTIRADARAWVDFLNGERPLWWLLVSRKIRPSGPLPLFAAFGKCFST